MLRSCLRPLELFFSRLKSGDELLWHLDLKKHANGDFSIAVVQANNSLEDQGQVLTSSNATYVGVYDGHGGPEASRFVNSRLFPHLHRFTSEHGGLSVDVIKKAFHATEEEFLQIVKHSWLKKPQIASVGSCCLMGAITEDMIYVANLGDSRAVLGRKNANGQPIAERLTSDHNVAVEEVRKELAENHPDDSHIVINNRGVWRIKGIIQVSRSIGDVYLKKPDFSSDPLFQKFVAPVPLKRAVVTSEPSVYARKLKPNDMFLIFASDGLWDQLSDEAAVEMVFKNPRSASPCMERAVLNQLVRYFKTRLAGYPTTLSEDEKLLEDNTLDKKRRVATQLVMLEKKILHACIEAAVGFIKQLPDNSVSPCPALYAPELK